MQTQKIRIQDKPRSHTFRHPPPYLGIISSRYSACVLCETEEKEVKLNGGTSFKTLTRLNIFIKSMEMLYAFVRNKAWTLFHPPPLIEYGRPIITIETGSQRARSVPD